MNNNRELSSQDRWLCANRLSLNIEKTSCIIISNLNKQLPYTVILKYEISLVKGAKFIGVYIDDRITFNEHINTVCKKVSNSIGVLRKVSIYVPNLE